MKQKTASCFFIFILLWCILTPSWAVSPDSWKTMMYSSRDSSQSLSKLLNTFAQAMGLKLNFQEKQIVVNRVEMQTFSAPPSQFLDRLGFLYGFSWYVHTGTLYVSSTASEKLERIQLGSATATSARQTLVGLGIFETKFGWADADEQQPVAIVTGPSSYVALVRSVLSRNRESQVSMEPEVMVFQLKHASAADYETMVRDRPLRRSGVATTLRNLLSTSREQSMVEDWKAPGPIASSRMTLPEVSLPSINGVEPNLSGSPTVGNTIGARINNFRRSLQLPVIDVYEPLNAVLIRDLPDRRAMYAELIKQFDIPMRQVEIVATIVDVDVGTLREWLPSLNLAGSKVALNNQLSNLLSSPKSSEPNIVLAASNWLNLQIQSLESSGKAQVQSRPSVMTLDNLSAVLDLSQTAYIKLLGERTSDLKSVTVGTMLKVTPRIQGNGANYSIRINVDIEDGTLLAKSSLSEDQQAARSFISTQAILNPRESLVIGGYQRDHLEKQESGIPILSALPGLGRLFTSEVSGKGRRERLFILTARAVTDDSASDSLFGKAEPLYLTP